MKNEIKSGIFTIENQILKIENKTVNLTKIDNMEIFPLNKYPLTSGISTWVKIWITSLIVCAIFSSNNIIGLAFIIYTFSIFGLLFYNYQKHQEQLYALVIITTARTKLNIVSNNEDFLKKFHNTIEKSINSKKTNYTINLDNRVIHNNNIVSKGNKNKNQVIINDNNN